MQVLSGAPVSIVEQLSARGFKHLYIDGGQTIQAFLDADLINEIILTRIPVLLGQGIALFGEGNRERALRLISTSASENGFVQSYY